MFLFDVLSRGRRGTGREDLAVPVSPGTVDLPTDVAELGFTLRTGTGPGCPVPGVDRTKREKGLV